LLKRARNEALDDTDVVAQASRKKDMVGTPTIPTIRFAANYVDGAA